MLCCLSFILGGLFGDVLFNGAPMRKLQGLEGHHNASRSQRFKKLIVPKYQDSTPVKYSPKVSTLFKVFFDSVGFTYVSIFSEI